MTTSEDGQFPTAPAQAHAGDGSVVPMVPAPDAGQPPHPGRVLRSWGPAIAWMALIFVLSAQAGLRVSDDPGVDLPIRHFAHVLAFGALGVLLLRALTAGGPRAWSWRTGGAAIALATLYGVTDEIHQTYVPLRTGHAIDVGWDLIGATAGIVILRFVARRGPGPGPGSVVAGQD